MKRSVTQQLMEEQRVMKRPRVEEADQPPSDRAKLKFIFERYNHYASGTDNSPASKLAMKMLQHSVKRADSDSPKCMLCLETVNTGDGYTVLPCGHVFHTGDVSCCSEPECGESGGRCKGIMYWLNENCACPTCRHELDRKFKKPTEEERLLIPIIKRQNSCLKLQEQLVQVQRRELMTLRNEVRKKSTANLTTLGKSSRGVRAASTTPQRQDHTVRPVLSKETKKEILACVLSSLGDHVAMTINNLETLSVIVSRVEREVLKRAVVVSYTLEPTTLRSLIQEALREVKDDKVGHALSGVSMKRADEERRSLEQVSVTE